MKVKIFTILALAALLLSACGGKSDADLQKAASEKLAAEKVAGVNVAVKDGVATLTGEVADITVKNKAASAVKGVEGIKSVEDKTTTKPNRGRRPEKPIKCLRADLPPSRKALPGRKHVPFPAPHMPAPFPAGDRTPD